MHFHWVLSAKVNEPCHYSSSLFEYAVLSQQVCFVRSIHAETGPLPDPFVCLDVGYQCVGIAPTISNSVCHRGDLRRWCRREVRCYHLEARSGSPPARSSAKSMPPPCLEQALMPCPCAAAARHHSAARLWQDPPPTPLGYHGPLLFSCATIIFVDSILNAFLSLSLACRRQCFSTRSLA